MRYGIDSCASAIQLPRSGGHGVLRQNKVIIINVNALFVRYATFVAYFYLFRVAQIHIKDLCTAS